MPELPKIHLRDANENGRGVWAIVVSNQNPFDTLVCGLVWAAIRKPVERILERRGTEVDIGLQPWLTEGGAKSHLGQGPEVSKWERDE